MSEPRDPRDRLYDPDELLEEPKPVPWYRRPRVWVATGVAAVILAFIFSRGEWHGVTFSAQQADINLRRGAVLASGCAASTSEHAKDPDRRVRPAAAHGDPEPLPKAD